MGAVPLIIIAALTIALVVLLVLLGMKLSNNHKLASGRVYYPFDAKIDPTTGTANGFTTKAGAPQISCPVGKKINIVGAFFNVFDPYNECVATKDEVDPNLSYMCDPTLQGTTTCSKDSDCPAYNSAASNNPFVCNSSGYCQLNNVGTKAACPNLPNYNFKNIGGYCIDTNLCGPDGNGLPNPVCSPANKNPGPPPHTTQCAIRDASATVAAKCDGKQECNDLQMSDFGDYPCVGYDKQPGDMEPTACLNSGANGISFKNKSPQTGYCALPYLPGWQGGVAPNAQSGSQSTPANANLGYTMHGIYTCV